ncbi:MAG: NADH-quinone oxidoreductase subunit C [Thermofilaceae archaeon]|nr:NADH-quinone oxidoreductase subunit C [Thermofilaceae archaeon]MDW8003938.1 NADH-quinone oxidoreductase subunit C [Thermofilaceae archaeon]
MNEGRELDEKTVLLELKERLGSVLIEARSIGKRRVLVTVDRDHYKVTVLALKELGFDYVDAITGLDAGDHLEVITHLGRKVSVSIKAIVPRDDPRIPSIIDLYPGVVFYERETWEMFGIVFEGNPRLTRTFLPDDWPQGVYPLRKDYDARRPEPAR